MERQERQERPEETHTCDHEHGHGHGHGHAVSAQNVNSINTANKVIYDPVFYVLEPYKEQRKNSI